jgi:hypothetical protein
MLSDGRLMLGAREYWVGPYMLDCKVKRATYGEKICRR